jgi:hypothetical protein
MDTHNLSILIASRDDDGRRESDKNSFNSSPMDGISWPLIPEVGLEVY